MRPVKKKERTVNFRMFLRTAALAAVSVLTVSAASGQAPAGAAPAKIGVIDIQAAISSTAEGKQANAELQSQFAPRQTELQNLNKQIEDLRQRLSAGGATLSDEEKARLQRQGETLTKQIQRKQEDYQEDVNGALRDVTERIGRKMIDVLDRYSRENGYSAVLNSSDQSSPLILYKSAQIDVTQDIVRLYDQTYPIKGTATAPAARPATAKPATAPATKPAATAPKPQ